MKKINDNDLFNNEINELENELELFLNDAEKILGHDTEGIDDTINQLLSMKSDTSKELANDILEIQNDIQLTEEFFTEEKEDNDPFINLYTEDNEF